MPVWVFIDFDEPSRLSTRQDAEIISQKGHLRNKNKKIQLPQYIRENAWLLLLLLKSEWAAIKIEVRPYEEVGTPYIKIQD